MPSSSRHCPGGKSPRGNCPIRARANRNVGCPTAAVIRSIYQYLLSEADREYEVHRTLEEIAEGSDVRNSMSVGSALTVIREFQQPAPALDMPTVITR